MPQYRKKTTPIEAIRYDGTNAGDVISMLVRTGISSIHWHPDHGLRTTIGRKNFTVPSGKWIVVSDGKAEILDDSWFQAQYEAIDTPKPPTPSALPAITIPNGWLAPHNMTPDQNPLEGFAYDQSKPGRDEYYDIAEAAERGGEIIL